MTIRSRWPFFLALPALLVACGVEDNAGSLPSSGLGAHPLKGKADGQWPEERLFQAEVTITLPQGIAASALAMQRAHLTIGTEAQGWHYIYVDAEHDGPYIPVCCLPAGTQATLSFDGIVAGTRLVGAVSWLVEGLEDPLLLTLNLEQAPLDDFGGVELTVLADRWEANQLASGPFANVGVYLGDWQAGNLLGNTGDDGKVSFLAPGGSQTLSAMVMTSSHSLASGSLSLEVLAGQVVSAELHMAPVSVYLHAHYDTGMGRALYITGASDYLGNWQTATRMSWNGHAWELYRNLPLGLPFKVVMAPWSDDPEISTAGVIWEQGPNRVVTPPSGYVSSDLTLLPSF